MCVGVLSYMRQQRSNAMLFVGAGGGHQLFLNEVERRGIFALNLVN